MGNILWLIHHMDLSEVTRWDIMTISRYRIGATRVSGAILTSLGCSNLNRDRGGNYAIYIFTLYKIISVRIFEKSNKRSKFLSKIGQKWPFESTEVSKC